ncbi:hypothetical protein NQ315_007148 [Exocentrus adspersus]|uniref:DUF3730 domain-containing protein n=1 Tax=Exocentrus adspersus TaxID=1586481 RepID=A0AAV8WDT3_9CUCU|nr:hypothetical protein NQ315_007148 [Exocentrus adspersus]
MEELESKLNSSNPIVIAQIFSKIIERIHQKYKNGSKDNAELNFLREKCMVAEPLISEVASEGLIRLVEDGILPVDSTLADFITSVPVTKCYKSLIRIIGNLLYLENTSKVAAHKHSASIYNLWFPQHPYITILNENPDTWNCILNEIKLLRDAKNSEYVTDIFRPVFLYGLCNPIRKNAFPFKQIIWNFVLSTADLDRNLLLSTLGLLQVDTRNNVELNSELISEAVYLFKSIDRSWCHTEIFILWQASLLQNLALYRLDLRPCICNLKHILTDAKSIITINCMLLILSKTITICSSVYLLDLFALCQIMLSFDGKEKLILETLKSSLLPWLANPSLLTYIENYTTSPVDHGSFQSFVTEYKNLISTNRIVCTSVEICSLLPYFTKANRVQEWTKKVDAGSNSIITDVYNLLCGLFVSKHLNPVIHINVFKVILKYVEGNKTISAQLLTLILYKLSNTTDSKLHFILLKALPKMIVIRDNIPTVMAVLQALSKGSIDLYNFTLSLMYEAWEVDNKCYSYLETMLMQPTSFGHTRETYITKSFILRNLCEKKPELYGKEIVAHLSKILNECNDDDGSLSCAIALDGIRILCKVEVIDIVTTWATLSPKFKNDARIPVIKSLCSLLEEIPHLPYTEAYVELQEDAVKTLWNYVNTGGAPEIIGAALNSLTSYSLEQICSQLPEEYLDEDTINERKRSVVGVPQTVPGKVWVKFLMENRVSKEASDFLIKMISNEVAGYLKYVYQVKGHREPISYDYLPTHSIVRGIGEFIRTWAHKWKHSIHDLLYVECLRIFSKEYSKPLPPLDWCFLQELIHDVKVKHYCIDIASHQAILSGTARRLMENYIVAEDDIMNVLRNLNHLANSIQPIILKPFFEKAIAFSIEKYETGDQKLLKNSLLFIEQVLRNNEIQETNKITVAQVLSDRIAIMDIKSGLFNAILKCVIALPKKCIDEIANLKTDVSEEWLEKVTKVRCSLACNTKITPLIWLSEIIEISSKKRRNSFIFQEFISVFRNQINNPCECALWLLELIGQIQAKVAERCDEKEIVYFFEVFILTVVEFSGYYIFIMDENGDRNLTRKELFPQALNSLLCTNDWSVCTVQVLEWLFHMNTEETVPSEYKNLFGLTLWCLRHDEEFIKNFRWMKYLSSKIDITNTSSLS